MPVLASDVGFGSTLVILVLAFVSGAAAYFICWPYGLQIGVLAPAAGMAVWGSRSSSMARLLQNMPQAQQRLALYGALRWESLFWLAVVAAGFSGVLLGHFLLPGKVNSQLEVEMDGGKTQQNVGYLNIIIALAGSALIGLFVISILARDVLLTDGRFGHMMGQPSTAQIGMAVMVGFGAAAFAVKVLLGVDYIWPVSASFLVGAFALTVYAGSESVHYLAQNWPGVFFLHPTTAILPIQLVSFAVLGSVAGYWWGVRYNYWKVMGV